ncbi:uncharacterized protein LOC120104398 [Phoenix dactylifera]|uniref:Uncharacterized protein LOC120104398 n=1 Tax=Phoenix dactylifera TaxID=42345 RepID=A0A8B8ZHV3_PHODC|nr:uncharacterized protein LOC120104398 [Phoenix dactylifera]
MPLPKTLTSSNRSQIAVPTISPAAMERPNLSPLDLKLFHSLERAFFRRLVGRLGQNQDRMMAVIALWLWFESIGHHDFIRNVAAYPNEVVLGFVEEADACLERLLGDQDPYRGEELPLTNSLIAEPMMLRFFEYHRIVAVNGVRYFLQNVCEIIFDDTLTERVAQDADRLGVLESRRRIRPHGEGTSKQGAILGAATSVGVLRAAPPPAMNVTADLKGGLVPPRSMLNPLAKPWSPATDPSPEDQRSMFITFSRGHPISKEDILEFFTGRFGPCIDMIMIERAPMGGQPMYGRVVFSSTSMIAVVLNGQRTAKFIIKGKHLWARIYIPRP